MTNSARGVEHVFVHEHVCGGGSEEKLPRSLAREGLAMLRAMLADLERVGVSTTTTLDGRLEGTSLPGKVVLVDAATRDGAFRRLASEADGTMVIAPECRDIDRFRRTVIEAGGRWFGSDRAATELAADKLALSRHLIAAGVPALRAEKILPTPTRAAGDIVVKPRFGAGSEGVKLYRGGEALPQLHGDWISTPYHDGVAASVLVLCGQDENMALPPCEQRLSDDDCFRYLGGVAPLGNPRLGRRAYDLALQAVDVLPGLRGFAGVDLSLGDESDLVVEINARLTTSYVGLRHITPDSLASSWLDVWRQGKPTRSAWFKKKVVFDVDGELCTARAKTP